MIIKNCPIGSPLAINKSDVTPMIDENKRSGEDLLIINDIISKLTDIIHKTNSFLFKSKRSKNFMKSPLQKNKYEHRIHPQRPNDVLFHT